MRSHAESLVVGGGLAGSMAALELARSGRAVTLLEMSRGPHDKICGEFLSSESLQYLERHGLSPSRCGGVPIQLVRLVTASFVQERPLPFAAWSLTRRTLDERMLELASLAGVQVERNACVDALTRTGECWAASLRDGGAFEAHDAILATGKFDLRGWSRPRGRHSGLVAFKMYYRLSEQEHDRLGRAVELVLHPGGYTGLQPVENGLVNLCMLIHLGRLKDVGSKWDDVLRFVLEHAPHLKHRLEGATAMLQKPLAASHIPYGHLQRETADGLWRVGDQAAVIPSFCGDGMAIALHSGALAASYVVHGSSSHAYQRDLRRQLATRIRLATALSQMLVAFPQAAQLARVFPGMLRTIAAWTRIPDDALATVNA